MVSAGVRGGVSVSKSCLFATLWSGLDPSILPWQADSLTTELLARQDAGCRGAYGKAEVLTDAFTTWGAWSWEDADSRVQELLRED